MSHARETTHFLCYVVVTPEAANLVQAVTPILFGII